MANSPPANTNPVLSQTAAPDPSASQPPKSYTYYHAGPLFTLADLHTNSLLSTAINRLSSGKYIPVLPQDLEQRDFSPHAIRDQDIRALVSCDLALFLYEGAELDPGTVVEYMIAKTADIPTVILRTDFRGAGDQGAEGDSWNLMSSFWPRSVSVGVHSMLGYKGALAKIGARPGEGVLAGELLVDEIASKVVAGFDQVLTVEPQLPPELRESVYKWLGLMPGFRDGMDEGNMLEMAEKCREKVEKGLL